jgi:hypothetical protein
MARMMYPGANRDGMRGSIALLVLLLLAGCSGTDEAAVDARQGLLPPTTSAPPPGMDFTAGIPVPVWNVGDWWQYTVVYNSGETYDAKIIVYKQEGGKYLITTDNTDLLMRAAFNHYPTISAVTKTSLDQFIHGVQVSHFKFPMKNQSWSAPYRDFEMKYETKFATLDSPMGKVPGFTTTLHHGVDGKLRMAHGWSPLTKWFTDFTWDFDGTGPVDVTARLTSFGSNFTGTVPVVDLVEIVHRPFPTVFVPPGTTPTTPNPQQSSVAFKVGAAGSTLLVGMFAGAGGQGSFQMEIAQQGGAAAPTRYEWQPTAAGSHFEWHRIPNPAVGDWHLAAEGAAQNSAFLFGEAYEARTTQATL